MAEVKYSIDTNLTALESLEQFLRQVKKAQEEKNLSLYFQSFCKKLREVGFVLIPSYGKVPISRYQTDEDKKIANSKTIENSALILIPEWLAVIDIDDVQLFCEKLNTNVEELEKVANVKTGKGYHIYIFDQMRTIRSARSANCIKDYGFEILRNENDVVMLPGSRIYHDKLMKNVCYEVLNIEILTAESISLYIFLKNALTISQKQTENGNGKEQSFPRKEKEQTHRKINIEKLKKIIKKHYKHGDRQNICIYTAGLLAKSGVDVDTAIAIISEIASDCKDGELKMRVAGVRHTYQDFEQDQEIKGFSGLVECGIDKTELNSVFDDKEKEIKINIPSVTELLQEFCNEHNINIDYDEFYVKIFVNNKEIDRETEIKIQYELERKIDKRISDEVFQKAVESIAYNNKRDRLKEFLQKCKEKWDGKPRIHTFFHDVFKTPLSQYTTTVSKNFFVSAVARAMRPGCFQKHIVVVQGAQDLGKSRALMALGKEFHREINVSVTTEKDFYMAIQGVWIAEIPEMDALRKADRNRVKAIISSTIDRFRPPYSRHMQDFPRRCIFTCTTNDQTVYDDPSGGTRFWIIEAKEKANIEYIEKNREQLFGEAVHEYEKGYQYWNIDEEQAKEVQENARRHDEWEQIITDWIARNYINKTTVAEIAEKALFIPLKDLDKSRQMRIAECLTVLGFRKKTVREGSKVLKIWLSNSEIETEENDPF